MEHELCIDSNLLRYKNKIIIIRIFQYAFFKFMLYKKIYNKM